MLVIRSLIFFTLFMITDIASALRSNRITKQLLHSVQLTNIKRAPPNSTALFVELPVDHFGSYTGKFQNRYWINDTYYESGGPVFIYDCGEINCESSVSIIFEQVAYQSSAMQLAQRYAGLVIIWEHRYYGQSQPFLINANFTPGDEWQYLTFDQALEDFVYFANNFTLPANGTAASKVSSPDLILPSKSPWIFIGGSYPGVRSAVLRIRNPEVVFASWASSAPVQAQVDMSSYYEAIERSLPRNCSADWVAVTKYVDDTLKGNNITAQDQIKYALYKAHFSGPGGNTTLVGNVTAQDLQDFSAEAAATILLDPLDFFQSVGLPSTIPFCDRLETRNFTQVAQPQGLVATLSIDIVFQAFMVAIAEVDYDALLSSEGSDPVAAYSWNWQYCSEFGYFQAADPTNNVSIETSFISLQGIQQDCIQTFVTDYLPNTPNVTAINKYGGWNMDPSNVFFSNGQYDPWRTLSVGSLESNSPQRNASANIPACNTSPGYPGSYFGLTYPNQVHGSDIVMLADPSKQKQSFIDGLALFGQALDTWLPCFGNVSIGNTISGGTSLSK